VIETESCRRKIWKVPMQGGMSTLTCAGKSEGQNYFRNVFTEGKKQKKFEKIKIFLAGWRESGRIEGSRSWKKFRCTEKSMIFMEKGLERFRKAQKNSYDTALREIKNGQKRSHWMWYIFPQIAGLGYSQTAQYYAIVDLDEAKEFLKDDILGKNLIEISEALLEVESNDATHVMGWPDDLKLRSSMTLFALADPECDVFRKVLDKFYGGEMDERTIELLGVRK
jgi:uncharacterized protein (DUF1810 family)